MQKYKTLLWLRDDLRVGDNIALCHAVDSSDTLLIIYILENNDNIRPLGGATKWWLHNSLIDFNQKIQSLGNQIVFLQGDSSDIIPQMVKSHDINQVIWSRRYNAIETDTQIKNTLINNNISVKTFNNSLLFDPWQVLKDDKTPYTVYTPFFKRLFLQRDGIPKPLLPPKKLPPPPQNVDFPVLFALKLLPTKPDWAADTLNKHWHIGEESAGNKWHMFLANNIANYNDNRNFPDISGTSALSPHIRFGEISVRQLWHDSLSVFNDGVCQAEIFLKELAWREFAYNLLYHNHDLATVPFRKSFADFPWHKNDELLKKWQSGQTGYPIVDAGMRQLWQTGWMHNRVRMIVASFLTKHLLLPWQSGEEWFWDTLVDADCASNPASWQWVAGCGADAAPYFRIFNPILQSQRFDASGNYIKTFVPELSALSPKIIHTPWQMPAYPKPIIDHETARDRAMQAYQSLPKP